MHDLVAPYVVTTFPELWRERYFAREPFRHDPVINACIKSVEPLNWRDLADREDLGQNERWVLECKFPWDEREEALERANILIRRHYVQAVRVIRERYDKVSHLMTESTIFDTSEEAAGIGSNRSKESKKTRLAPLLAALDIRFEDEDAELDWDLEENHRPLPVEEPEPPTDFVRRLVARVLAMVIVGLGLSTGLSEMLAISLPIAI
ncbi:MAG: hypothetical protein CL569_00385 [Alphaproteobacteria bacterium]|nr:hypothetical protein [Alphaproteobacteria bacterium]|tara:strand:- start:265 stop:885 length:621 start_codon:yes stop_codon:yes gene_type:complete